MESCVEQCGIFISKHTGQTVNYQPVSKVKVTLTIIRIIMDKSLAWGKARVW